MQQVYLDNAATTKIRDEVIEAMTSNMRETFGNPSSLHSFGRLSKSIIETCRKSIANQFNVSAGEIFFTSGGTEADNLILRSAVKDLGVKRIITTKIEHHAVLHTVDRLKEEFQNISVEYLTLNAKGDIDVKDLETLLSQPIKTLVSLMHINNEIGNILDLKTVAEICKTYKALFHSDTVQSVGHYELNLKEIPIDFMVASAHKFHGPKGIGFAFVRKNSGLKPLIHGGEQERGLRAGTESVHNIVGLDRALKLSYENLEKEANYLKNLKSYFIDRLTAEIPNVHFNGNSGDIEKGTYTLVNVCLPIASNKTAMFLFQLDLKGIACSKGSACQSGSSQNSHVLSEILNEENLSKPSIRFSFSIYNTKEDMDYVVDALKSLIN